MKHLFLFFKFVFILCLAVGLSIPGLAQKSPTPKSGSSQDTDDSSSTSGSSSAWNGYRPIQVRLPAPGKDDVPSSFPFGHFVVQDARPDTARIGTHSVINSFGSGKRNTQLRLSKPAAQEISGYLNDHYAGKSTDLTALVIIRTCWVSDMMYAYNQLGTDDAPGRKWLVRFKAEVYAGKNDSYTPLRRFDSCLVIRVDPENNSGLHSPLQSMGSLNPESQQYSKAGLGLATLLMEMMDDIAQIDIPRKLEQGRRLSMEDIHTFNKSRFDLPVCKDSSLAKGVYLSFDEFKNNAPSVKAFEIHADGGARVLYLKDDEGKPYLSREAWGYCDGHTVNVMIDGKLYPTWKEQNAYYVSGDINFSRVETPALSNLGSSGRSFYSKAKIYSIDMDTGLFY